MAARPHLFFTRQEWARILPFIVFIILLASTPLLVQGSAYLGFSAKPVYLIRTLAAIGLLIYFWRDYSELHQAPKAYQYGLAVLAGLLVFAVWILPYPAWLGGDGDGSHEPMPMREAMDVFWLICRWSGSALVVPIIEELFWRSYFMRKLDGSDFMAVPPASVTPYAVAVSSVLFAIEHQLWFAGLVAGLVYAWLYRQFRVLWIPVIAHMTTNAVLGAWVVYAHQWQYW